MSKLTKKQAEMHDEAVALLSLERALTPEEVEFVYTHWREDARHVNTRTGAFFTPPSIAWDLAVMSACGRDNVRYVDICAGTGVLSWALIKHEFRHDISITAVEVNPDYVEVGERLLPDVDWICADVFDQDLWLDLLSDGKFDVAVSNPPFGRPATLNGQVGWLKCRGPAQFYAAEVALRVARSNTFIFPANDLPFVWHGGLRERTGSKKYQRFQETFPQVKFVAASTDISDRPDEWHGATPRVNMAHIEWDAEDSPLPIFKQPALI